ncbi:MAG TPA: hypothetical protein VGF49_06425 [Candidatus Solibacter sp.]|jgi:hypothetical protein
MPNEPTKVTLLDQSGNAVFSVAESHHESLNNKGSDKTRSIRIEGPVNCVDTCFDDQEFRMGQNSVQITKTVGGPVVVPIGQNSVQGQQKNGVFMGTTSTYKWQFNKAIEQKWWTPLVNGGWEAVKAWLTSEKVQDYVSLGAGVDAYVSKIDRATSDNNHVDNLSSIKFGT